MKASELIKKLQAKIDKYGDKDVCQLFGTQVNDHVYEALVRIKSLKYRKKIDKFFVDFV